MTAHDLQDRFIDVHSVRTRYWMVGDSGRNILLLHGIGGSVEIWIKTLHTLAERYTVYALDLVGFGLTDKPDAAYSLSFQADFVHSFMNALEIDNADIVGLDLGGGVAVNFGLRYPKRMERLILVDSVGLGREVHDIFRLPTLPLVGGMFFRPSRKLMREIYEASFYDPEKVTDGMVDFYYKLLEQPGAEQAFTSTLRALGSFGGMRDMIIGTISTGLIRLEIPTLLVWGRQDEIYPVEHALSAHDKLPDSRLHIIDECGHLPPMEQPEKFNQVVLEFLHGDEPV